MAKNKNQSSPEMAAKAARAMQDQDAPAIKRKLAASVLSQSNSRKQTGAELQTEASRVLRSDEYCEDTKSLAASLVSQSNRKRINPNR